MECENKLKLIGLIKNVLVLRQPTHKAHGERGPRDLALKKVAASFGEPCNQFFRYFDFRSLTESIRYTRATLVIRMHLGAFQ